MNFLLDKLRSDDNIKEIIKNNLIVTKYELRKCLTCMTYTGQEEDHELLTIKLNLNSDNHLEEVIKQLN